MKKAYIMAGAGSQSVGMCRELYNERTDIKQMFEDANDILGYRITDIMFEGPIEKLQTIPVSFSALYLYYQSQVKIQGDAFRPDCIAGHSLGSFHAAAIAGCLTFEQGLLTCHRCSEAAQLVHDQKPCQMAAIMGMEDEAVEELCQQMGGDVYLANYNNPGQVVIGGALDAVKTVLRHITVNSLGKVRLMNFHGAFHTPLMSPAMPHHIEACRMVDWKQPNYPIYSCQTGEPMTDSIAIRTDIENIITHPVRWSLTVRNMVRDGMTDFVEIGEVKTLTKIISHIPLT